MASRPPDRIAFRAASDKGSDLAALWPVGMLMKHSALREESNSEFSVKSCSGMRVRAAARRNNGL